MDRPKLPDLARFGEMVRQTPGLTLRQLQYWMHADRNGFRACVLKIGRVLLLDRAAFEAWRERTQAQKDVARIWEGVYKRKYAQRKAAGVCPKCGEQPQINYVLCRACCEEARQRAVRKKARHALADTA
jgi:hypothetical protein